GQAEQSRRAETSKFVGGSSKSLSPINPKNNESSIHVLLSNFRRFKLKSVEVLLKLFRKILV
ncbi:MAG: hypothetical protein ACFFA5_04180, partial [Promethearchaeota archaeon]